ncbi:MAG TPA: hypothetical protein VLG11_03010 [Candidatus Saccharimonadales bacterium]|nr:hypothetical protein [Candidatus Saccharimonadales bacterium]
MHIRFTHQTSPEAAGAAIAEQFEAGVPYVHAQGLPFAELESGLQADYVRRASQAIGKVTLGSDAPDSDVWRLDRDTDPMMCAIPFRTDNAFYETPERFIGLWCVQSAAIGGENRLLAVDDLLNYGGSASVCRNLIEEAGKIPVTFTDGKHRATAPILDLDAGTTRFSRAHVIKEDADLAGRFSSLLATDIERLSSVVRLQPGEALLYDNHRMFYGRRSYSYRDRLALRTRILDLSTARP